MADFLLELRSEEIPARMQAKARNDLSRLFAECAAEAGLSTGAIEAYSTPRRLVLIARDVAASTEASREELKGPRTSAPPQALEGFLRKTGLRQDQLEERDGVYFAVVEREGRPAIEILADTIKRIVADFPWPKSMRWGDGSLRWVRPLPGIVALLGEEIVPVEIDGIAAGATTVGHRFHHPGPITIGGAADYVEKLRACHVIVDHEEREAIIRDGAAATASEAGLTLLADEGLVVENAGLTEWPVPMLGRFDAEFLDVPREVIVLTMRTNQKYFACTNDDGLLAPAFVCVANIAANDGGKAIVEGNRRVLAARLSDARFFWEQDLKVPLEEQAKKLGGIVFHEKLGTVADKVERVAKLARRITKYLKVEAPDPAEVERAARLAKADLVTGMVGEFPELQGVVGAYIAERQGESKVVADAIRDHYKPVGPNDVTPSERVSVIVAVADKIDTAVGFFGIKERPTGSRDPFGLRRAALGVIRLILENGLRFDVDSVVSWAVAGYIDERFWPDMPEEEYEQAKAWLDEFNGGELAAIGIPEFIVDRLKVQQREAGVRHDVIDAVFGSTVMVDLMALLARVNALQTFIETEDGANLLTAYKRAANILKKEDGSWTPDQVRGEGVASEEVAMAAALDQAESKASKAIEAEDFTAAMAALAALRGPIDAFFDKVTVNDPDKPTRARRLNLLARFRDAVNRVADFSKIEG